MKRILSFALSSALFLQTIPATGWAAEPLWQRYAQTIWQHASAGVSRAKANPTCRKALAATALGAGVLLASWGYYNWAKPDGKWREDGRPLLAENFSVVERFTAFTLPRERTLWIDDGKNSFGAVYYRGDKIQYFHGRDLVAETCPVSPYGHPYDADHPLEVFVYDRNGKFLGSILETSRETKPGTFESSFTLRDRSGVELRTLPFVEGAPVQELEDSDGKVTQRGYWALAYHWSEPPRAEVAAEASSLDPRVKILATALQSLQRSYRQ